MLNDFFNLIFPKLCGACNEALLKNEASLCTSCQVSMPKTNYHLDKNNPVNKVFWGRSKIEMAAACYKFNKKSKIQHVLHQLKYKGNKEIGFTIGKLYGHDLSESDYFKSIDYIVPVPLHSKKLKKRGYNQCDWIAKGLSSAMDIPVHKEFLFRKIDSKTQITKSRYKRWKNVENIFGVKHPEVIKNKNILLVDDIITTGATIESCANALLKNNCKIYVATIAYA